MTVARVDTEKLLTTADAAEELDIPVETVQQYCRFYHLDRTPAIRCHQFGRSYMIERRDLDAFKANRPKRGRPPKQE